MISEKTICASTCICAIMHPTDHFCTCLSPVICMIGYRMRHANCNDNWMRAFDACTSPDAKVPTREYSKGGFYTLSTLGFHNMSICILWKSIQSYQPGSYSYPANLARHQLNIIHKRIESKIMYILRMKPISLFCIDCTAYIEPKKLSSCPNRLHCSCRLSW